MGKHSRYSLTPEHLEWLTPVVRTWLYGVVLAVIALLGGYGLITDSVAPLWVALAAALLGQGTAMAHTPKTSTSGGSSSPSDTGNRLEN